jgi:hypothetical protein
LACLLIPVGMYLRQRRLKAAGQIPSIYPEINLADPMFRHGVDFVVAATFINFVIVGTASYRGVAYMDTPSFCGVSCHVMGPEWTCVPRVLPRGRGLHGLPHCGGGTGLCACQGEWHQADAYGAGEHYAETDYGG